MNISVIIPAHNEEKYLEACLESLIKHQPHNLLEIIVVDNASTDDTTNVAKRFPNVKVVHEAHKGLTHARQRGLREAKGSHLAYVDADTRIHDRWFAIINEKFAAHPELVALSGPYEYFDLPVWQITLVRWYWRILALPASLLMGYVVVGGNFVAKKESLELIGGFDTTIAFYGEDTNIGRRLHHVGKVHFHRSFFIHSSGRRLAEEGMLKTGWTYVKNFLSEAVLHRPLTKAYTDVR